MRLKTAVRRRILELCAERDFQLSDLQRASGIPRTTLRNILNGRNNSTTVTTLMRLCDGFGITLCEFFDSDKFRDLEQEIV